MVVLNVNHSVGAASKDALERCRVVSWCSHTTVSPCSRCLVGEANPSHARTIVGNLQYP